MARKKKKKEASEGAPAWMVTYGDMMTLLLCFFVMIVAMSELKKDERFRKVVESLQREFGYSRSVGMSPADMPPEMSPTRRRMATADENKDLQRGFVQEDSQVGDRELVVRIREGQRFTVGGVIGFAEGSAELPADAHDELMAMAARIRGLEHKIELYGHTSAVPLEAGSSYADHMDLSIARAMVVRRWLIGMADDRGRIDPRRIRVVGAGRYEPLVHRAYERPAWSRNDRVDVVMIEALAPDFEGEPARDDALTAHTEGPMGEMHAAGK
ncbi:MAG: OmpA/MotB family protein [Planctomycetota bacterium]